MSGASLKRKMVEGHFFITSNTLNKFPYFKEDEFAEMFIEDLFFSARNKEFEVNAYKLNPDHIHLILRLMGSFSLSQILQNTKRTSSLHCNQILYGKKWNEKLEWTESLENKYQKLHSKYRDEILEIPMFKWQASFYDHMIRDETELKSCVAYINYQWIKHDLKENKFCFVDEKLLDPAKLKNEVH